MWTSTLPSTVRTGEPEVIESVTVLVATFTVPGIETAAMVAAALVVVETVVGVDAQTIRHAATTTAAAFAVDRLANRDHGAPIAVAIRIVTLQCIPTSAARGHIQDAVLTSNLAGQDADLASYRIQARLAGIGRRRARRWLLDRRPFRRSRELAAGQWETGGRLRQEHACPGQKGLVRTDPRAPR